MNRVIRLAVGLRIKKHKKHGRIKFPNLQDPKNPIYSWNERPAPTGFDYVAAIVNSFQRRESD